MSSRRKRKTQKGRNVWRKRLVHRDVFQQTVEDTTQDRNEQHAEPHIRPISCHVTSLPWQEPEELNKLLLTKVSDRDRNVKSKLMYGCVWCNFDTSELHGLIMSVQVWLYSLECKVAMLPIGKSYLLVAAAAADVAAVSSPLSSGSTSIASVQQITRHV